MEIKTIDAPGEEKKVRKFHLFKEKSEMKIGDYIRNYTLETLAVFLWIYTLTKIFIFDIDHWLVNYFMPNYEWVLNFKFIYILALASFIWLLIGTRDIVIWFLYISFYPFVTLLVKIPYRIIKQQSWLLAFVFLNTTASFFVNLKRKLIITTIFMVSFSLAVFSNSLLLLIFSIIALLLLVCTAYINNFLTAIRPTIVFRMYTKFFVGIRKFGSPSFSIDENIKKLPIETLNDKQLKKWGESLQASVLFNRLCLFGATKLRDYQQSEWRMIPSIFGLLKLIAFTTFCFSGIYFALYKINNTYFATSEVPGLFSFFYYSFNNFILNSIPEIVPSAIPAKVFYMIQSIFSFLLVAIIVTLTISHRAQKTSSELDEVIDGVEKEAILMERFIHEEYNIENIVKAIDKLKEVGSELSQFIYWLSKGIR